MVSMIEIEKSKAQKAYLHSALRRDVLVFPQVAERRWCAIGLLRILVWLPRFYAAKNMRGKL
jgi:hypothetical protein